MRSIQDVGTEILGNEPRSFYVFGGNEYGIKQKYLSILKDHYQGQFAEVSSMSDIIGLMSTKHLIPLQPKLYIVRYDEEFVRTISDSVASKLHSLHIIGTIVCIYESDKYISKLDKFLSDDVVRMDEVNIQFKIKYLHSDFPNLPDRFISLAAKYGDNYSEAQKICRSMSAVSAEKLFSMSDDRLMKLFGKSDAVSEDLLRAGIASRNFSYLSTLLDQYDNIDSIFYTILSTMLELEKIITNKYAQSDLREYAKRWTLQDVYNMFMQTYEMLKQSRSYSASSDVKNMILYLFSLLKFQQIPDVTAMEV